MKSAGVAHLGLWKVGPKTVQLIFQCGLLIYCKITINLCPSILLSWLQSRPPTDFVVGLQSPPPSIRLLSIINEHSCYSLQLGVRCLNEVITSSQDNFLEVFGSPTTFPVCRAWAEGLFSSWAERTHSHNHHHQEEKHNHDPCKDQSVPSSPGRSILEGHLDRDLKNSNSCCYCLDIWQKSSYWE